MLLVLTPAVAMTAVAIGLRLGARGDVRAAIVYGAPAAGAQRGPRLADRGLRRGPGRARAGDRARGKRPLARAADASAQWHGVTNADGVAEARLELPHTDRLELEVRSAGAALAQGEIEPAALPAREPRPAQTGWLRFARREGSIALDVAAFGQRVAPGFPAELWVRATDARTQAPIGDVAVALDSDTSLTLGPTGLATARTDSRGWARIVATPVGLAVTVTLRARSPDARSGDSIGGLFMSPGAPSLEVTRRAEPGAPIAIGVTMPTARNAAYVEIDDSAGRAWAATAAPTAQADGASAASVQAPGLTPGLYWAVAAADPASAASLAAGTIVRPFFVASSDEAALAFGTDRAACAPPRDPRETASAVSACLALSAIAPVARWTALDGFVMQRARGREARAKGLAVALGALAIAILLEAALLLRAGVGGRGRTVAVAVLVGLLGFALLAAFIVRV